MVMRPGLCLHHLSAPVERKINGAACRETWPSLIGLIGKLQDTHLIEEGGWEPEDCWRLMVRLELIRIFVLPPDPAIRELDHVD